MEINGGGGKEEEEIIQKVTSLRKSLLSIQIQAFAKESSFETLQESVKKIQAEMESVRNSIQSNEPVIDMIQSLDVCFSFFDVCF